MAMHRDIERRDALDLLLQGQTRRHFFARCGVGLGSMALASLLGKGLAVWPSTILRGARGPAISPRGPGA